MEKESRLKYSLAVILALFLNFNVVMVWLVAKGHPLISVQDAIPIGIKWLILIIVGVLSIGIAFWVHTAFLKGGVGPQATTWVDLVVIAYAVLTMIALLFIGEGYWILLAVFLILLFLFSAFVLHKLLENNKGWLGWLVLTLLLAVLLVIFISTMLPS
jgi:hypothetical protein